MVIVSHCPQASCEAATMSHLLQESGTLDCIESLTKQVASLLQDCPMRSLQEVSFVASCMTSSSGVQMCVCMFFVWFVLVYTHHTTGPFSLVE